MLIYLHVTNVLRRITSTNDEEIVSCEALGSESSSTKGVNSNSEKGRKRRPWRQARDVIL